ncbi:protein snakeskin [Daktulosphaira vitifoliae]|uniref:protein snakeskin n=1 Tax=Daktulosphaira vitifoliae TaxID=58002 RepID=UPI0021AACFEB|nr:protein snakeskin [Daktulosphaira vitifoliae]
MVNIESVGTVVIKVVKLVLNIIILVMYRTGYRGQFLGVGGTWNLNEEKNPDAEIVASGVFVGFFIYTLVILISYGFGSNHQKKTLVDIIMNFAGMLLYIAVGGIALHYWIGYQNENKYIGVTSEKAVGITLGSLCVLSGAIYLGDTVLSFIHFAREMYFE